MAKQGIPGSRSALQRFFDRHNVSLKNVWPARLQVILSSTPIGLLQRIRPRAKPRAKMEVRASGSS